MTTTADTVPVGDFEQQTQKFLEWFTSQPGVTFHKDIKLVDLRDKSAGRGIIATAPIPADTTLFTIPRASILCATTSPLASKLPHLFKGPAEPTVAEESTSHTADDDDEPPSSEADEAEDPNAQDSWTLLILILIHEYLHGPASAWFPYLSVLPQRFDTPMFWTETELRELQASALVAKVGKEEADAMIRTKIVKVVKENEEVFYPAAETKKLSEEELLVLGHRMGSAIMAYAFDLAKEEDEDEDEDEGEEDGWVEDKVAGMNDTMGMVPMADMLNADAVFNAHINHGEACLTATSLREIKEGEEILNYYGPLSSAELLRRYGYVTPNHGRYDVVEVGWGLVEKGLKKMVEGLKGRKKEVDWLKVEELVEEEKEAEGEWEDSFVLERQSEDPDSEGQVHGEAEFMGLPEELEEQVKTYLKAVKKVVGAGDRAVAEALGNKTVRKEILLGGVRKALEEREGQYATSLEEDEKVLGGIEGGRPTTRKEMAVWVRAGEKRIIREAVAWVKKQEEELNKEKGQEKGEPSAKRRKA